MDTSLHHGAPAPGSAVPQRAPSQIAGLASLGAPTAAAVLTTSQNDEALGWQAEGDEENTEPNNHHSAQTAPGLQPEGDAQADRKRFSTLQAQLALRGFALNRIEGTGGPESYTVTRWGLVRELVTLEEVAAFAVRVGVPE